VLVRLGVNPTYWLGDAEQSPDRLFNNNGLDRKRRPLETNL
jgi:hypothetical protein